MMLKRLRMKFICINMVIVTGMLCLTFVLVYHFIQLSLERESVQMMQALVQRPIQPGFSNDLPERVRLPYFILRTGPNINETSIVTNGYYDLSDEAVLGELLNAALVSDAPTGVLEAYNLRFYRAMHPGEERVIFADISSERATLKNLLATFLLVGSASFLAFLGISFQLSRWAIRPVEQAWTQQRQFVADASHELKTPLTVIMTNAELLQASGGDEAVRTQSSASILAMSQQMRGLVEGLLDLARTDAGVTKDAFVSMDLSKLVSDALLPFEPLLFEAGLTLSADIEPDISLRGSPDQLRQVVHILLDNARKYTSPGGKAAVTLRRRGRNRCLLSVATTGEELSREELKNIFKRFYRADRARSMNHSYGLGLSIAESIVSAHHGRIWAESGSQTNTFFVELPVT